MVSKSKWLIVAPHCDDMEYGMGGYLARMKGSVEAHLIVMSCSSVKMALGRVAEASERVSEQEAACELLGVNFHRIAMNPENGLLSTSRESLVRDIETAIREVKPDEVFIPLPSVNQDHQAVHEAAMTALRPRPAVQDIEVWAYEYPGNCWGPPPPSTGKCHVRLTDEHVSTKLAALRMHQSQLQGRSDHDPYSLYSVENMARERGRECCAHAAEVFYLQRWWY